MLTTLTTQGAAVVDWTLAQPYLKAHAADQSLVESLIERATTYGETWTGRAARANVWTFLRDDFYECDGGPLRIPLADVGTAVVARLVSDSFVDVDAAVCRLKSFLSDALVVERSGQGWPSDADDVEHAVRVTATQTRRVPLSIWQGAILRHVALLWADRGDAEAAMLAGSPDGWTRTALLETAKQSGAEAIYAGFRVPEL